MSTDPKVIATALRRLELLRKQEAFDPNNLLSIPTEKQKEVFADFGKIKQQWVRAGNQSGKSQTCARIVSWVLTDTHPTWKKPANWGQEPLLVIVAGRTGKQIEDSLLPKLRSFLEPGTYKEVRIGNIIQRLELANGNRVIFQSLENPNTARERLQSYVAHLVWIDELPPTLEIVRELLIRVQARDGYFLASFTPTVVSADIQRYVDHLKEPEGKVYRFHMLDNPLYSDPERKAQLLARYGHLSEEQQRMVFEGEWLSGDDQVYYFNWDKHVHMPEGYSPLWRHVESVDPALKSALGLTIWAEDPKTAKWYCILSEYIRGIYVPTELIEAVRRKTANFNIVRRIADPHEVWYIQTANAAPYHLKYIGVYKKNDRKAELIKNYQEKLGSTVFLTPISGDLNNETQECRWSDRAENKIVNASSYHLLDSAHYFCDNIPKYEQSELLKGTWQDQLYKANEQRKLTVERKKEKMMKMVQRRSRLRRVRGVS